jgi:uncharacterized membrane protein YphA (DoxX/SURF4 family)
MHDSMAHAVDESAPLEWPAWKTWVSAISAVLLAILFIVSGVWKVTDPLAAAVRMAQAKVPNVLSLPTAVGFGIAEAFAGVLLLVPRFRRWGAWLTGLMLVAFLIYIGVLYNDLRGEDCNCFPWVKRAVGPAFFIGDLIMLAMAVLAGWWVRPSHGLRSASIILGAVCVFAFASLGIHLTRQSGAQAPETVMVDGKAFPLREGRVFLFFFNPECSHCNHSATELAKLNWGETKIVGVVTQLPQFGPDFMRETGLKGVITADVNVLKNTFSFVDVPFGVALENGRQRASFPNVDPLLAAETLRKLGFVN